MNNRSVWYASVLAIWLLLAVACGNSASGSGQAANNTPVAQPTIPPSSEDTQPPGDPEIGRKIFSGEKRLPGVIPCSTCHYVEARQGILVGPNMEGLAQRASTRVSGLAARAYLEQSIRDPEAYTVEGFPPGTMNEEYGERLTQENINHVIAYLLTL